MSDGFPSAPLPTPKGDDLLRELGEATPPATAEAVLRDFAVLVGDDRSSSRLRQATGGEFDLDVGVHRTALLKWLRSWGCRHLRVADTRRSSRGLSRWWAEHRASLPASTRQLTDLADHELDAAAVAYGALASTPAAWRSMPDGRASVSFGETAAAKALFAIRPLAFPPWDAPIRAALGLGGAGGPGYRSYLEQVSDALRGLAGRLDVTVDELPAALGRPASSPPKLVDEYLWMRVNRQRAGEGTGG